MANHLDESGETNMTRSCWQKMVGPKAANLYYTDGTAVLAMMDPKTGNEKKIAEYENVSEAKAVAIASSRFGSFEKINLGEARHPKRTAGKSFRSARRKFSMEERIRLIDEDMLDDEDL